MIDSFKGFKENFMDLIYTDRSKMSCCHYFIIHPGFYSSKWLGIDFVENINIEGL